MSQTALKRIILLLMFVSIVSVLWAVGSTSRKHVELETSSDLHDEVNVLKKTNTALTIELKDSRNQMAAEQKAALEAREQLKAAQAEAEELNAKLEEIQLGHAAELNVMKVTAEELTQARELLEVNLAKLSEELQARQEEIDKTTARIKQMQQRIQTLEKELEDKTNELKRRVLRR